MMHSCSRCRNTSQQAPTATQHPADDLAALPAINIRDGEDREPRRCRSCEPGSTSSSSGSGSKGNSKGGAGGTQQRSSGVRTARDAPQHDLQTARILSLPSILCHGAGDELYMMDLA
jgi:hypothetical protein